ncbi:hypothetical protein TWF718_002183 [Orbilia javanica]|uniref:Transmembrane protein n=1 Tax=Orbilia javanica TaxID=47235 RepID=A0AAN8RB82_9PEZI
MGLYTSRRIIAMENQQVQDSHVAEQQQEDDTPIFHQSKLKRVLLGIGLVLQACVTTVSIAWVIVDDHWYNSGGFTSELLRFLALLYTGIFLWNSTTWFLCIYYNKCLPRNKRFIVFELIRLIPLLLSSAAFLAIIVPEGIASLIHALDEYYGHPLLEFALRVLLLTAIFGPAIFSLVWMFIYFIKERKDEIIKIFKIGKKKGDDDEEAVSDGQDGLELGTTRAPSEQDGQEAPLLIDHDQIV